MSRIVKYAVNRLSELSTYRAADVLITYSLIQFRPEEQDLIINIGILVYVLLGLLFPDRFGRRCKDNG